MILQGDPRAAHLHRLALGILLGSLPAQALCQEVDGPSGATARKIAIASTAIPVAGGLILWFAESEEELDPALDPRAGEPDRWGATLAMASGFVLGPAVGYLYGDRPGRAWKGSLLRAGLVLLSFVPAYAVCGWDCSKGEADYDLASLIVATGAGLATAHATYDIIRMKDEVDRRSRVTVGVYPASVSLGEAGLILQLKF